MLALLEQWWPTILALFVPIILQRLGIKVPLVTPNPAPSPTPDFPKTIGNGEVVKWLIDIINKGLQDGTIKIPFTQGPVTNAVQLTPEQVMQLLKAQPAPEPHP